MAVRLSPSRLLPALLLVAAVAAAPGNSATGEENPERERAQARLKSVLEEIGALQLELQASRKQHHAEQSRLQQVDLAIQEANLKYRALERKKLAREAELRQLQTRRAEYLATLDARIAQLAEQVRSSYRAGHQSRMKLVLNQDDPTRIGRMLAYYDYINQAQVTRITGLREALSTLDTLQQSIDEELAGIALLQDAQREVLDQLESQRQQRAALLAELSGSIGTGEAHLKELERNRADLQSLIERLADVLADIPDDLGDHSGLQHRKGHLPMPVNGRVQHAFGQTRPGGLRWQGWLISAEPGTEVSAIAYGRVAFADWLRGYGLLMIIDHGQGFMSLYGHNESLLQEPGAWVDAGAAISVVGSNPGSSQGIYFELRKQGKAVDPAAWLAR